MASGGEGTFREYAINPYDYEPMAASAERGEGAGNSAQSDISEDSHSENSDADGDVEAAGRAGNTDW